MKQLIALVAIAAGTLAQDQAAIEAGASFSAPDDQADKLVAAGDAKLDGGPTEQKSSKTTKRIKARLLVDSALGNANDVVEIDQAEVKALERDGMADSGKEAVAYAQTLPQNKAT